MTSSAKLLLGIASILLLAGHRGFAEDAQSTWTLRDGTVISLVREEGGAFLKDSHGETLLDIPTPLIVDQTVISSERTAILMRMISKPASERKIRPSWYSHLALVYRDRYGQWKARRVLSGNKPPMKDPRQWIAEIGAISNAGTMALMKIGHDDGPQTAVRYIWRTLRLGDGEVLAEGKELPNSFEE